MSGFDKGQEAIGDKIKYSFDMNITIPSYLLAMAVGDLAFKQIGPRTGIICEPVNINAYSQTLDELEELLKGAEDYLTPYIWSIYNILILPASFPYGGMENPLLTFASPTIMQPDKSQVFVATHEICHSWTGNDVTCENWSNMWLNEGFTVFCERKVSGKLEAEKGYEDFAKVEAFLGNVSMVTDMMNLGIDTSYSSLHPVFVNGANPDDAFSTVPYEKGY